VRIPARGDLPDREFSAEFLRLRALVLEWLATYYDGEHLERAGDWLLALAPDASEPLVLAALTHDLERTVPGGPVLDKARTPWDDPDYNRLHCERSVEVVTRWLREQQAPAEFIEGVRVPIAEHEFGGSPEGDLAQAADSLSWLEVNARLAGQWVAEGACDMARAEDKLRWMLERIRLPHAADIAKPLHRRALEQLRSAGVDTGAAQR
jgi:hypothetical protein